MITTWFLDMDGVLADFITGICAAHNKPTPYDKVESQGVWDTDKLMGIEARAFYAPCNENFWKNLWATRECEGILACAVGKVGTSNVALLTSPTNNPGCVPGKKAWVQKHMPVLLKQMIFTGAKHYVSGPGKLLVDDNDHNVTEWRKAGGKAILIPRPWNSMHAQADRAYEVFMEEVKALE